jgi:NAD(P)-dependent dehydrogenase (short-subunit alcohol dehydrogenase family)
MDAADMAWDLRDKVVLVTGATSGIGLEACVQLCELGARVVMVGRDPKKTEACTRDVMARGRSEKVSYLICDFASQAQVRELAANFRARHDRLHVLVNNAGTVNKTRRLGPDGIEATFAVNHLGYFLLTNLLCSLLVASAPARVISVASVGHRHGTLDFDDLGFERGGYTIMKAYGRSKLANVLFAAELARRLAGTGVTSNSLHPGGVATNIWSGAPLYAKPFIALAWPFFISARQGASYIVELATRPELQGSSGVYFERDKQVLPAPAARNEALAERLWLVSAELTELGRRDAKTQHA